MFSRNIVKTQLNQLKIWGAKLKTLQNLIFGKTVISWQNIPGFEKCKGHLCGYWRLRGLREASKILKNAFRVAGDSSRGMGYPTKSKRLLALEMKKEEIKKLMLA